MATYHVIEKDDEVVFYIPYDKDLTNVYTKDFFALHSQNAEVAIIAFHNNEYVATGGDAIEIFSPYQLFYNKAKYVEDQLKNTFNQVPSKESSYNLFSALISNTKNLFSPKQKEPTTVEPTTESPEVESIKEQEEHTTESIIESPEPTMGKDEPTMEESIIESPEPTMIEEEEPTMESVEEEPTIEESIIESTDSTMGEDKEDSREISTIDIITEPTPTIEEPTIESVEEEPTMGEDEDTTAPLSQGYIFQITIQKKLNNTPNKNSSIPKLKIPMDVMLEKEIDYFREHAPNRPITQKYARYGIYMLA